MKIKVISIIFMVVMVLSLIPAFGGVVYATDGLRINGGELLTNAATINSAIETALESGDVTVTGTIEISEGLFIGIPANRVVTWNAELTNRSFYMEFVGGGTFNMIGGRIESRRWGDFSPALMIFGSAGTVNISDGTFAIEGSVGGIIDVGGNNNTIVISGGNIGASYLQSITGYGENNTVFKYGGNVDGFIYLHNANFVLIEWDGEGTEFSVGNRDGISTAGDGVIIKIDDADAWWDLVDGKSGISYERGTNSGFIEVPGVTVTGAKPDTITAEVFGADITVTLSRPISASEVVFVAIYENEQLIEFRQAIPQLGGGGSLANLIATVTTDLTGTNADTIKAMWWDGMNSMRPICENYTLTKNDSGIWGRN